MIDIIIASAIALCTGAAIGVKLKSEAPKPKAPKEPQCTGYRAFIRDRNGKWSKEYVSRDDCEALRSPTCMDGRCTLHCRELCRCEHPAPTPVDNVVAMPKKKSSAE